MAPKFSTCYPRAKEHAILKLKRVTTIVVKMSLAWKANLPRFHFKRK